MFPNYHLEEKEKRLFYGYNAPCTNLCSSPLLKSHTCPYATSRGKKVPIETEDNPGGGGESANNYRRLPIPLLTLGSINQEPRHRAPRDGLHHADGPSPVKYPRGPTLLVLALDKPSRPHEHVRDGLLIPALLLLMHQLLLHRVVVLVREAHVAVPEEEAQEEVRVCGGGSRAEGAEGDDLWLLCVAIVVVVAVPSGLRILSQSSQQPGHAVRHHARRRVGRVHGREGAV